MPARSSYPPSPEFERVVNGAPRPRLDRVALEIARDAYPDLNIEANLAKLDELADRIRGRCRPGASQRAILGQINWALFVEEGYEGNVEDYFDPRNSYLNEVINRKTGIPISLSILYWSLAERLGVTLSAANLPAHFMLRAEEEAGPFFIDPFHGGDFLDHDACARRIAKLTGGGTSVSESQMTPAPPSVVVARMLRNLKAIYLGLEDFPAALQVQRRLAAVADDDPREQRDLGMLCLQLDRHGEAIDPLAAYLKARPEADDAPTTRQLLDAARSIVAQWN